MFWIDTFLDIAKKKYTVYSIISIIMLTLAYMVTIECGPKIQEYLVDEFECRVYEKLGIPMDLNSNGIMKFEAYMKEENEDRDAIMFESEYVKGYGEEESIEAIDLGEGK